MSTYARRLAEALTGPAFLDPPPAVLDRVRTYVLDTLAVGLAGSSARSSQIVANVFGASEGQASIFGTGKFGSVGEAALVNGAASHALELDDDHRVSVLHPGAVVVPAAFAMAEGQGASGATLLRAVLAGYEVAIRVGDAFQGRLFARGFHPTAACGVFGAAAAGATILGLDAERYTAALAIAGTQASGLTEWRTDGSWIKRLHPGRSAQSGLIAALLARDAFTGPATIFEGRSGFFGAFLQGETVDGDALVRNLGQEFRTIGTAIKPFPCCRFAHGTIDLAIAAHCELGGKRIEKVTVRLYRTDVLTYHHRPMNAVDAQFNVPYLIAVALGCGAVRLQDFTAEAVAREDVLSLADRVETIEDEEFSRLYPETYISTLEIAFADGSRRIWRSECPSGDPEAAIYQADPGRFHAEAVSKTRDLLAETGFGDRVASFLAQVEMLDGAPNVAKLADLMRAPPRDD